MIKDSSESKSSQLLDPIVLARIEQASKICLLVASLVAAIILSGWFLPVISSFFPDGWALMQASTALMILFISIALALNRYKSDDRYAFMSLFFAFLCLFLVGATLSEHWYGEGAIIGRYLVANEMRSLVGSTSVQSVSCFFLLTVPLFIDPSRQDKRGWLLDFFITLLVILNLLYAAGHIYQASSFVKSSSTSLLSLQTLVCVALLTFVQAARRAPYGAYSIVVSKGIGGHIARILLPASLLASYAVIFSQTRIRQLGLLSSPYDAALTAVALAVILIVVVILMARKIDGLESRLRRISITDEMTGIYNFRGFSLLGKQELLVAKRSRIPLTILYFDVDGLKKVNDTLGHDVGSQLICDVATLLSENFRASDIVARIGGDEFAVIAHGLEDDIGIAIERIYHVTDEVNESGENPYDIGFSVGRVMFDAQIDEQLEGLLSRADAAMYQNKKERRGMRMESDKG